MMFKSSFRLLAYLAMVIGFSVANAGAYEDFFKAVAADDGSTVLSLMVRGFDPNSRDEKGQTGLFLAMRGGSFKVAENLLQHPQTRLDLANASAETALMMAALKGHHDWVKRLLDRGARSDSGDAPAWTALHYAATGPSLQAVQWLLARGAKVDARSPNGSTALMMAARYGPEASVTLLLQQGADAKLQNEAGLTAADFAKLAGREAVSNRLLQAAR